MGWVEPIKRGGVQTGRYRGVAWDAGSGRRCRPEGSKVFATWEAADAWWQARERRCDQTRVSISGEPVLRQRRRRTFAEFAELWHAALEGALNTRRSKAGSLRYWVGEFGEDAMLDEITATMVRAALIRLRDERKLADSTRAARLRVLQQVMAAAVADGELQENPLAGVAAVRECREHTARVLTDAEMLLAMSHMPVRLRPAVLLAYDSGLRIGEVAGLRRFRLDLDAGRVLVADVIEPDGSLREHPKGKRRKWVPLTARTVTALREHLTAYPCLPMARLFGDPWEIRASWATAREAAGLTDPAPRFHDLRHSCATNLARAGAPADVIMRIMRHESLTTTQRYIAEADISDAAEWVRYSAEGGTAPANRRHRPAASAAS